tara:strand:+ start:13 stop:291 length:279 start_codon:yes stop_codon:yes gene_type:complete
VVCCAFSVELKSLVVVLVVHLISAGLSKTVAAQKARHSNRWAVAGLLFGPLGLIAAVGMPDRHQIVYLRYLAEQQGYQPRHAFGGKQGNGEG